MEPFSDFGLQAVSLEYLLLPPRSALKVVPPTVTRRLHNGLHAPAYSLAPTNKGPPREGWALGRANGEVSAACLSAIHFRGRFIRQVSCYTLLSGCRLPWPPSCCLDESTPFMGSAKHAIWRLNLTFGSSPIAIPAYQVWPTKDLPHWTGGSQLRNPRCCACLKFENKSRVRTLLILLIIRFTRHNCGGKALAILRETSAGTSYQMVR